MNSNKDLFRENFPEALLGQLKRRNWSQRFFALEVMNVSPQAVTGWLKGSRPDPEKIAEMAVTFEADYETLLATGLFTPSRYRPSVQPTVEETTGGYEMIDPNTVPASEFEARHADLLRKYIALPTELKLPIRSMIENASFLLAKMEPKKKTGTHET